MVARHRCSSSGHCCPDHNDKSGLINKVHSDISDRCDPIGRTQDLYFNKIGRI